LLSIVWPPLSSAVLKLHALCVFEFQWLVSSQLLFLATERRWAEHLAEAPSHEERADNSFVNNDSGSGDESEAGSRNGGDPDADADESSELLFWSLTIIVRKTIIVSRIP
jgi:hypothetical protein